VASALLVAVLGMFAAAGAAFGVDRADPAVVVGPPLSYVALVLDFSGEPMGALILVVSLVAACLIRRQPRTAALGVAASALAVAVTALLKPLVGRTIHGVYLSFPSGHTAAMTAFGFVAGLLAIDRASSRQGRIAIVLGTAVVAGAAAGWAQVVLATHYPTDAVAGLFTALAVVPTAGWLVDQIAGRAPPIG
jgi:membrane-associated phospholipid phosphatase